MKKLVKSPEKFNFYSFIALTLGILLVIGFGATFISPDNVVTGNTIAKPVQLVPEVAFNGDYSCAIQTFGVGDSLVFNNTKVTLIKINTFDDDSLLRTYDFHYLQVNNKFGGVFQLTPMYNYLSVGSQVTIPEFTFTAYALGQKREYSPQSGTIDIKLCYPNRCLMNEQPLLNSKVKKIVALEIGHVGKTGIAGGDRLLPEMVKHLNSPLEIDLIIPKTNTSHWLKPQKKVNLLTLNRSLFDRRTDPLSVFATYMQRIIKTVFIVAKVKSPFILYSSTGIFPDVVPAFFIKFFKPKTHWIARIHHISLPPTKRPGPYWVNLGAHILERISLWMIQTKANIIIVLNNNLKKELSEKKFDSDKMVVLGGGVDFGQITKTPSGKVKLYDAVFLGRLHYAKGVLDLAPIWKKVVEIEPLARLGIIGTGPEEVVSSIKRQIADYKLTEKIDLLNFIPQKKVWKTLKSSKIFLFCDHEAGFGLAVAEAMAAGMPVVGWDIGILGSVFKTGFIKIPLGNHELFAENIAKILKDKNLYLKLSDQAQKEAKKIDWSITGQKFVKILNLAK